MEYEDKVWTDVATALSEAKSIAWDGCHKIYILLDDQQSKDMIEYGYNEGDCSFHYLTDLTNPIEIIKNWWEHSCGLRFISAVATTENPNDGFIPLISQFEDGEDEEDEDY